MDLAAILAKLTGAALLVWTLRSIYKHFFSKVKAVRLVNQGIGRSPAVPDKIPSFTEAFLNNLLLYLWLAFMLAFSTGMIVNN